MYKSSPIWFCVTGGALVLLAAANLWAAVEARKLIYGGAPVFDLQFFVDYEAHLTIAGYVLWGLSAWAFLAHVLAFETLLVVNDVAFGALLASFGYALWSLSSLSDRLKAAAALHAQPAPQAAG